MKVGEIYTPNVLTAAPAEDLGLAASRMDFHAVGALLVKDGMQMLGILTERDILRAVAEGRDLEGAMIAEYMTEDPVVVTPETEATRAAATMLALGVRHLPVKDRGDITGMLSARDLLAVEGFEDLARVVEATA